MRLRTWPEDPAHIGTRFKVLGQLFCVLRMALSSKTQSLDTEKELLCGERAETRANVAKHLNADSSDEGSRTKSLPVLEAVIRG